MAAAEVDVSRLQTTPLFEKRRARKLPQTPERQRQRYFDLWDGSVWEEDERSLDSNERPAAIDDIMRRSSEMTREENDENKPPATDKERAADIETAIKWIRQELSAMREQDRKLLRQFTAIRNGIQHLKAMQDVSTAADADSEGEDQMNESRTSSISNNTTPPRTPSSASPPPQVKALTPTSSPNNYLKKSRVSQLAVPDTPKALSAPSSPVQLRMSHSRRQRPRSIAQPPSVQWQGMTAVQLRNGAMSAQKLALLRKTMSLSPIEAQKRRNKRNSWC